MDDILVETWDARNAVCISAGSRFFGWAFYRHADGQWVTLRKASKKELYEAINVYAMRLQLKEHK